MERRPCPNYSPKRDKYLELALKMHKAGSSVRTISEKIGVSKTHIHRWIRKFAVEITNIPPMNMEKPKHEIRSISEEELSALPIEEQVAKLKEALRRSELRADLYDEIINVAEAKFKINIRKKAGAKQ